MADVAVSTLPAGRPHLCSSCGKRFKSRQGLLSHLGTLHPEDVDAIAGLEPKTAVLGTKLVIVLEDDWLAVVVKPQGCQTMGPGGLAHASWLLRQLQPTAFREDALRKARPCHRLDAGTGGLVVLAKTSASLRLLCDAFARGDVRKRYRALVWGRWEDGLERLCEQPLQGKICRTLLRAATPPVETAEGWVSTLDMFPEHGRKHQLRRHCKFLGSPILGDVRYGFNRNKDAGDDPGESSESEVDSAQPAQLSLPLLPLCLWALEISLPHPRGDDCEELGIHASMDEPQVFKSFRATGNFADLLVPMSPATRS